MKYPKAYVLYANENYIDIVNACAKSIKTFSNLPVFVYLLNCDKAVLEADKTINWECDIDADETEQMYLKQSDSNFYVNRASKRIYRLIKERPLIVKHALKMANLVCYVDCDSIATKHIDRAFKLFNEHSFYPFFSEGIYDFLMMNGRGGATGNDLSTTLEHPACELFGINQKSLDDINTTRKVAQLEDIRISKIEEKIENTIKPLIADNEEKSKKIQEIEAKLAALLS